MKSPLRIISSLVVIVCSGILLLLLVGCGNSASENGSADKENVHTVYVPEEVADESLLERRAANQLATTDGLDVYHDFRYVDEVEASGIRFRHHIVDDAGITFKKVHYDHGNSVSVADVDNDGLYDVYFTNQVGENQLWRNLGGGRFEDITADAGVGMGEVVSVAASFADIDNDGDTDLFVTTVRFGNVLFENDGSGRFTDITASSGLDHVAHSSGSVFFDYDGDGLLDVFVTNVGRYTTDALVSSHDSEAEFYSGIGDDEAFKGHLHPERAERNILYRNVGDNRFVDVSADVGLVDDSWSGDATIFDGNGDGRPDLYILDMQGNDVYYENVGGTRFVEKTASLFPKTPWGAMGVKVIDYNNDGLMDLYVTDMHSDMWEADERIYAGQEKRKPRIGNIPSVDHLGTSGTSIFGNALFRNDGDGSFTDVADLMGAETYWPWGVSSGDLNADGFEDLFITSSMNYPYRYAVNKVLLNNRGEQFHDSEFIVGVEPRRGGRMTKRWFEVDCREMRHEQCAALDEPGRMEVWGAVGSRASAVFDLEGDGDLDIVTNEFNDRPMVLVSDLDRQMEDLGYLKVELVGTESNRDGLGALVSVHTDSMTITRFNGGKSGYLAQSSLPLYFGLGEEDVTRIEVTWPTGEEQVLDGPIESNTTLQVIES